MKIPQIYFSGFNGFKQFGVKQPNYVNQFEEFDIINILKLTKNEIDNIENFKIHCCWNYNVISINNTAYIIGNKNSTTVMDNRNKCKHFKFVDIITEISGNDNYCLILLKNGDLFKLSINDNSVTKLNFLIVEQSFDHNDKKINSNENSTDNCDEEQINKIICGHTISVALTNKNSIYNVPSKCYTFPKYIKISKICCGAEHSMLLTTNGDVYSWGLSSRGQLGLGKLEPEEKPVLLEALAGVKIIDIAAGAWHSAAVSVFGDIYLWGWNVNGQIGKALYKENIITSKGGINSINKQKLPSVFASPVIIDLPVHSDDNDDDDSINDEYNITNVYCGGRHTIVKTSCNQLFGTGWNKYGQLGIKNDNSYSNEVDDNIVKFQKINTEKFDTFDVICDSCLHVIQQELRKR